MKGIDNMSNSSLVNYTKLSPNRGNYINGVKKDGRTDTIKKITIHHMACNGTLEAIGEAFAKPSRQASSNYAIDSNGRVAMYVEEKDRSWCSGSAENDNQAITIEVANDGGAPDWHVSDKALAKLIELCVDICKRNNIKKLSFTDDKNGNLTMHKYFQATACPGPYLESKFAYIADEVNKRLISPADTQRTTLYKVQVGAFEHEINAQRYSGKLKADGFDCFVVHIDGLYKVQTGAFANELNAENFLNKLKYKGYKPFIITVSQSTATSQTPNPVQQVNYFPATPYTGVSIASGLSAIGVNGTYAYREKIAKVNGIVNYKGTAEQNTKMLNLLKQGKLIRP